MLGSARDSPNLLLGSTGLHVKTLKERIKRAKAELTFENNFDKVLINDNLDQTLAEAAKIVRDFMEIPLLQVDNKEQTQ